MTNDERMTKHECPVGAIPFREALGVRPRPRVAFGPRNAFRKLGRESGAGTPRTPKRLVKNEISKCLVILRPRDRRGRASITRTNLLYCLRVRPLVAQRQLPRPPAQLPLCAIRPASPVPPT